MEQRLTREEAEKLLAARREDIAPNVNAATQTKRGRFFEMIAELTDDGAISEMEDLGELWDDLADSHE